MNGPVPTMVLPVLKSLVVALRFAAGTIRISGIIIGSSGSGYLVSIRTLSGSTAVTCLIERVKSAREAGEFGTLGARSNEATTSPAVNGVPSENCTPGRSWNSHVVSPVRFHAVASAGATSSFSSNCSSA